MIVKFNENNRKELLEFLEQDATLNLFLIGDLLDFGFDDAIQTYHGVYNDLEQLIAVVFSFKNDSIHIYAIENHPEIREVIINLTKIKSYKMIMYGEQTRNVLDNTLEDLILNERVTILAEYQPLDSNILDEEVVKVDPNDAQKVIDLEDTVFERDSKRSAQELADAMKKGIKTVFGIYDQDKLVSVASATANSTNRTMIVGVGTAEDYRKKGQATKLVRTLSNHMLAKGYLPVLFYDNPQAKVIYERLGYQAYSNYYLMEI